MYIKGLFIYSTGHFKMKYCSHENQRREGSFRGSSDQNPCGPFGKPMPGFPTNPSSHAHPRHVGVSADGKAHPPGVLLGQSLPTSNPGKILAWWWVLTELVGGPSNKPA